MPDLKLSAGINFGKPETEFIVESTPEGVATSCRNVVTGVEYIGGGGDGDLSTADVTITLLTPNSEANAFVSYINLENDTLNTGFGLTTEDDPGTPYAIKVVLYKNQPAAVEFFDAEENTYSDIVVTGDITVSDGLVLISGGGTIVLSAPQ